MPQQGCSFPVSVASGPEQNTLCRRLPGIVPLLGSFEDDASVCLVQELCGRSDLFKRLVLAGGTLPESEVCNTVSRRNGRWLWRAL